MAGCRRGSTHAALSCVRRGSAKLHAVLPCRPPVYSSIHILRVAVLLWPSATPRCEPRVHDASAEFDSCTGCSGAQRGGELHVRRDARLRAPARGGVRARGAAGPGDRDCRRVRCAVDWRERAATVRSPAQIGRTFCLAQSACAQYVQCSPCVILTRPCDMLSYRSRQSLQRRLNVQARMYAITHTTHSITNACSPLRFDRYHVVKQ